MQVVQDEHEGFIFSSSMDKYCPGSPKWTEIPQKENGGQKTSRVTLDNVLKRVYGTNGWHIGAI
jgi:hypothetical protein